MFTEGYLNHMFRFSLKSDTKLRNALVVRIFGVIKVEGMDETFAFGKDEQVVAMQVVHEIGIAEKFLLFSKMALCTNTSQEIH